MPKHTHTSPRNLIVLNDGTWNREDGKIITNIAKLDGELLVAQLLARQHLKRQAQVIQELTDLVGFITAIGGIRKDVSPSMLIAELLAFVKNDAAQLLNAAIKTQLSLPHQTILDKLAAIKLKLRATLSQLKIPMPKEEKLTPGFIVDNILTHHYELKRAAMKHDARSAHTGIRFWRIINAALMFILGNFVSVHNWFKRNYGEHSRKAHEAELVKTMRDPVSTYSSEYTQGLDLICRLKKLAVMYKDSGDDKVGVMTRLKEIEEYEQSIAAPILNQVVYYDRGIGTWGFWSRYFTGATGEGMNLNIKQAYEFLAKAYHPADKIFLLGFSRGAYSVRSLLGMIHKVGLLRPERMTDALIEEAFKQYKTGDDASRTAFIEKNSVRVNSKFIGVYDTVGALGLPGDTKLDKVLYGFHDTEIRGVEIARHAVARDEHREDFNYTSMSVPVIDPLNVSLEQRVYKGVHSDVGGGYAEHGLSDGARYWIEWEAAKAGIQFPAGYFPSGILPGDKHVMRPDSSAAPHDSRYRLFGMSIRSDFNREFQKNDTVDPSVLSQQPPPIHP